jgi:Lanthionine synthetase C-like protein
MLYESEHHEPLTVSAWNEQAARACIDEILGDAIDRFSARDLWPSHPLDSFSPDARWNLYIGGAGTIWALRHLSGKPDSLPDVSSVVPRLLEPNRNWILNVKGAGLDLRTDGLLTADTGILLVQAMVSGVETVAVQLGSAIDANRDNPACEFMWGSPGTMLASVWLYEWTGQDIWAERFRRDASLLWNRLEFVEEAGCHLWVQNLYGHCAPHIGAVHGFAGNAFATIRGWHLLSPSEQSCWADRLAGSLRRTARCEDDCANWPQSIGRYRPGRTAQLVQHCHGAPGIVNCFAGLPDPGIDDLLIGAGELIWKAGPLRKGPGLCHGTAGNGYAFLKLFRRTGEQGWLDRARRFAMHAIEQYRHDAAKYGQRRYPLWTGDPGLAVYLSNCIAGTDFFPTLDNFFGP